MGSVVISIDAELAWGFNDIEPPPQDRIEAARPGWRTLASLFETYDIPATWAVVGHLFLEDCDGVHADHPLSPNWFEREHGAWVSRRDLRYGTDLVRQLKAGSVDHEIGSHTFSHVICDDPSVTRAVFRAELEATNDIVGRRGDDPPTSFVYPRNAVAHRDLLAEYGFRCYRSEGPSAGPHRDRLRKMVRLAGWTPPLVRPTVDRFGLVRIPPSLYLFGLEGAARTVVEPVLGDPILAQAKRGIDSAAHEEGVLHLWLHPNNLVDDRSVRRMRSLLAYLDHQRAETSLTIETMGEVAASHRTRNDDLHSRPVSKR